MKKTNKRSIMIIASMALLLAVIFTMAGTTFAKYVTNQAVAPSATVAKWGWVISANANELFPTDYVKGEGNTSVKSDGTGTLTIDASAAVVAPGAKGSLTFSIGGATEVLSKFSFTFAYTNEVFLQHSEGTYKPIVWTLKKGTETVATGNIDQIKNYFGGDGTIENQVVAPGQTTGFAGDYELSWEWPYSINATKDAFDTVLGLAANGITPDAVAYPSYSTTLGISITINAEQILEVPAP